LPTAALIVGARQVLAGTVDVGSTSTATPMRAFYRRVAAGASPSTALQAAQVGFLSRRSRTLPRAWAGLTIAGDGFG